MHAKLAPGLPEAELALRRADAWLRLMAGEVEGLEEVGKALYSEGSAAQDASMVIDATLMRAMAALTSRDAEEAKALSRRASRMARTEGLRAERFLASIVLARVRRRAGRPHLATRILSAIAPIAPGLWQGWLRWERILAGWRPRKDTKPAEVEQALLDAPDKPATRAARALLRWLAASSDGDREGFEAGRDGARAEAARFVDMAQEAAALAAALDPALDPDDCPEDVREWALGAVDETPAGLHGIVGPPDGPADSTIAHVVCQPGRRPRRLLRVATPLLAAEGEIVRLQRTRLRRGRVDTAVAALALAGEEGLADSALFEKAYEFEFVSALHAGILDVLVHRMRARLEGAATVHRKSGTMCLEPHGVLVLPDPRCVEHVEDRLLRVIARHGGITTRQAAQELDVSVRTAQLALRRLLASGDCVLNRDGRRVQYLVEDTTFTEPTRY
ncbi:MAG: hypothetical protein CMN31_25940 [Sandaracinus sp.]|nr:hypothetical protein [Sandaracinus sp.]MBJ74731.1 hypothetical protein [Sandaracinus sp.]